MFKPQTRVRVSRAQASRCSISDSARRRHPEAGALELQLLVWVAERLDALLLAVVALA